MGIYWAKQTISNFFENYQPFYIQNLLWAVLVLKSYWRVKKQDTDQERYSFKKRVLYSMGTLSFCGFMGLDDLFDEKVLRVFWIRTCSMKRKRDLYCLIFFVCGHDFLERLLVEYGLRNERNLTEFEGNDENSICSLEPKIVWSRSHCCWSLFYKLSILFVRLMNNIFSICFYLMQQIISIDYILYISIIT